MALAGTALAAGLAILVSLIGIGLVRYGLDRGRMAYRILSTSTSETSELSSGFVEVKGQIAEAAGENLVSPFGQDECVVADWEVEEWDEHGENEYWVTEAAGVQAVPFYLKDDGGRVLVDFDGSAAGNPGDATAVETTGENLIRRSIDGEETTVEVGVSGDDPPPAHIRRFVESHDTVSERSGSITNALDVGNAHGDRRYTESRLAAGDQVYVLGQYDGATDAITVPDDDPLLIADKSEWKLVGWRAVVALVSALVGLALLATVAGWVWTNLL